MAYFVPLSSLMMPFIQIIVLGRKLYIGTTWKDASDARDKCLQPLSRFARGPNSICLHQLYQNTQPNEIEAPNARLLLVGACFSLTGLTTLSSLDRTVNPP